MEAQYRFLWSLSASELCALTFTRVVIVSPVGLPGLMVLTGGMWMRSLRLGWGEALPDDCKCWLEDRCSRCVDLKVERLGGAVRCGAGPS